MNRRMLAVVGIGVACGILATAYAIRARRTAQASEGLASGVSIDAARMETLLGQPHALFRSTRLGAGYGHVVVAHTQPSAIRYQTSLECDRVAVAANASTGVCLTAERGVLTSYWAVIFDAAFRSRHRVELAGIPSRTRLSPDGNLAGITVFVGGHAYSDTSFSTQTILVDTQSGAVLADLEQFEIDRDGRPFRNANFNFWGVTFAQDSNTFYATLASGARLYLIRADAAARRATVIGEGVECPALSPDNRRIAFKKRTTVGGRMLWRLAVLDLVSGSQRVIDGEVRSVDDQVEWLDNHRVAYAIADEGQGLGGTSLWAVDVDAGPAALWADGAYSPVIISRSAP